VYKTEADENAFRLLITTYQVSLSAN